VCREIARDRGEGLAQFRSVALVPLIAKRAEPLKAVSLADDRAGTHHLPALAPSVARSTDVIQPPKRRGQRFCLGQRRLSGCLVRAIDIKDHPRVSRSSARPPVCFSFESGRLSRSSRNRERRASTGSDVRAAKKRESVERTGCWSHPNKAMKGSAKGCSLW